MKTKSQSYLLVVILGLLGVNGSYAQPPGYRAAVNKAVANANMQWQMNQMFHNMRYLQRSEVLANYKYEYTVQLKDSTRLTFRSRIHSDTVAKVSYLSFEDKTKPRDAADRQRRILPSETICVSRLDRSGVFIQGFPTDSCWLFRIESGKINICSFLSEITINTDYITAIQLGEEGPVEPLNEARLREMLQGDEKALRFLEKKNYYRAIREFNKE